MMYDHLKTVDDVINTYVRQIKSVVRVRRLLDFVKNEPHIYLCLSDREYRDTEAIDLESYSEFGQKLKNSIQKLFDDELFKLELISKRLRFVDLEEEK